MKAARPSLRADDSTFPPIPERERVLSTLNRLFRDHGYEGATLSRICAATGLPRGSLYYYFPNGKADMLHVVLDDTETKFDEMVLTPMRSEGPPDKRIRLMTRFLDGYYEKGAAGCILGVLALGETDERTAQSVRRIFKKWIDALVVVLVDAGWPKTAARKRARDAVVRIQGALIVCRGLDDRAAFRDLLAWLHDEDFLRVSSAP